MQQELTRHASYLRRGVECEAVHTCHPIKSDSQRVLYGGSLWKAWGGTWFEASECALPMRTCRFRPNVCNSERAQERRETPARPLLQSC